MNLSANAWLLYRFAKFMGPRIERFIASVKTVPGPIPYFGPYPGTSNYRLGTPSHPLVLPNYPTSSPHIAPRSERMQAAHALPQPAAATVGASGGDGHPTGEHHTTVNVYIDGKKMGDAHVRSHVQHLKQSMLSKGVGLGTHVNPAVATGNP